MLDRTEVTVAAYRACVEANACSEPALTEPGCNWGKPGRDRHPINCVTWVQANTYCGWRGGRLPTSQEWEFAATGPLWRKYPWGDAEPTDDQLCWKRSQTCAVGSFPASNTPEGLQDMAGNVYEWTSTPGGHGGDARIARGSSIFDYYAENHVTTILDHARDVQSGRRGATVAAVTVAIAALGIRCATQ